MKRIFNSIVISILFVIIFADISYALNKITAIKDDNYNVVIKGVMPKLQDDMTYINYNNRVYVPLRFISENMGLVVNYNNGKDIVISDSMATEINNKKIKEYLNEIDGLNKKLKMLSDENAELTHRLNIKKIDDTYKKLPVTYADNDRKFTVELYNVIKKHSYDSTTQLYFKVKNDSIYGVNIDPMSFVLEIDEKKYKSKVTFNNTISMDLFSTLIEGYNKDVFVSTEMIPEDSQRATLTFEYEWLDSDKKTTVTMPIKLD